MPSFVEHILDLRSATMHHDRLDAGLFEQDDIARKGLPQFGIPHGMTTIFDHDSLTVIALHEGECFRNGSGTIGRGTGWIGSLGHGATLYRAVA